jgi:hypothetical protein
MSHTTTFRLIATALAALAAIQVELGTANAVTGVDALADSFQTPPPEARPWVYWMFMDGNLTREGMTADLEAMKRAGIGGAIILEVNIGIPRGPVHFMSPPWRELIKHAIQEADRLGLELALGAGPGWCGTGGPWVKPEQSMQHLVASETKTTGPASFHARLPQPSPRTPFFGEQTLTPELHKTWKEFYRDVAVLAFPTPPGDYRIPDVDEKSLYYRAPYSSQPGVKPFLTPDRTVLPAGQCISPGQIIDLSGKLSADGQLVWEVPPGNWTILRFGRTTTGQTTRPAPVPGLGLESDKFDKSALDAHFDAFMGRLLETVGEPSHPGRGLTGVHFDSWEMSSQNWSARFREEFRRRRGYDPLRYLPAMLGRVVQSVEISERFLWDLRRTAQELVVENHALRLGELGRRHGLKLSIEPYDLNPAGDLALGAAADVPMCEFWSKGFGFSTEFSRVIRDTLTVQPASGSAATIEKGPRHHEGNPQVPDMYPGYEMTAQVLSGMGVRPDFESDGDVRYAHRHDQGAEIYFVGNRTSAPLSATCRFRVTELRPELWDPVTGQQRPLPEFRQAEGWTSVPLQFASGQSYFIVFRDGPRPSGTNFPELKPVGELAGAWEVEFDPKWGGPDKPVTFEALKDWTRREEDGIRHYSGIAIYRKTFDAPAASPTEGQFLDLGEVKNMAQVKLNGRDLGVVWCAPWRVVLPAGLLKSSGNQVEIKVANLWPNRLIKDAGLPQEQRLTWTTWSPYKPTDRLLPSGLLGPVRLLSGLPSRALPGVAAGAGNSPLSNQQELQEVAAIASAVGPGIGCAGSKMHSWGRQARSAPARPASSRAWRTFFKVRCPSSHTSETGTIRTFLVLRRRPSAAMAAAVPCRIGTRKP